MSCRNVVADGLPVAVPTAGCVLAGSGSGLEVASTILTSAPGSGVTGPDGSGVCQRGFELGAQVVEGFDADAQPHQVVGNPQLRPPLRRHAGMGHDRGVVDQALDAA